MNICGCVHMCACLEVREKLPRKMRDSLDTWVVVSCSMSLWKFDLEQEKSGFRIRNQGKSQNLGSIYLEEG